MSALARWRMAVASDRWMLLPLRVLVGFGFCAHGYAKLERGPQHFAQILAALHLPAPVPMAWATTLLELAGGAALLVGAAVAALSLPLMAVMLTALVDVHARYGFSSIRLKEVTQAGPQFGPIGYELNLLYIAALLALAVGGTTPLSVDRWLLVRRRRAP
jgi:putative oxidoreductase